ncbi:hypothetical protein CIL05_17425 [Virgibacillus profundi]|uniref:RNA polymerase sigma-70 region 2 domain-containing protein n=1 Tax=Virgibacillus profundi TaxID=2024555 RepID=A0A2A2IAV2_9BACI|nr:sigma-70 family RNA polymerase sigma factor [Virgibacillus profundi]PAV28414.1 hypothetical protein CIL05_17425 [Virgibacillus profundi]PXY52224.1 sigma-70 family RNA polymerase sigma factor [Virgibacillus profundi]
MTQDKEQSFEEIFKQNERRIYYHMQRLGIRDPYKEFYVEGLYAMWMAHKKYQPDKGPLSTYFNYTIRHRLIDMLRKKAREQYKDEAFASHEKLRVDNGNRDANTRNPIMESSGINVEDTQDWEKVKAGLTANQWNWVYGHIILEMPLKEIAEMKGVSVEAVKSWGKEARKKLRSDPALSGISTILPMD